MPEIGDEVSWSVRRRLEFIEFRLLWEGQVNRSDLVDFFGISVPQASSDLGSYQELTNNMVYDKAGKAYVAAPDFSPSVLTPSADRYLAQIRMVEAGLIPSSESWVASVPSVGTVPLLRRAVDVDVLRSALGAIRSGSAIQIKYRSFRRPKLHFRWIEPHALGFDGFRWHVRAYCRENAAFRDFSLARIAAVGQSERLDRNVSEEDIGWHTFVTLRIGPHPKLDDEMRKSIEFDYGMKKSELRVESRACMFFYMERLFGLDRDPKLVDPKHQQIVLLNRDEVVGVIEDLCRNHGGSVDSPNSNDP